MADGSDWLHLADPKSVSLFALIKGSVKAAARPDAGCAPCAPCADSCAGCHRNRPRHGQLRRNRPVLAQKGASSMPAATARSTRRASRRTRAKPTTGSATSRHSARAASPARSTSTARASWSTRKKSTADREATYRGGVDDSGNRHTINYQTGEQIFIDGDTKRRYRLDEGGTKQYEDAKLKPTYGGNTTWRNQRTGRLKCRNGSRGAVPLRDSIALSSSVDIL